MRSKHCSVYEPAGIPVSSKLHQRHPGASRQFASGAAGPADTVKTTGSGSVVAQPSDDAGPATPRLLSAVTVTQYCVA